MLPFEKQADLEKILIGMGIPVGGYLAFLLIRSLFEDRLKEERDELRRDMEFKFLKPVDFEKESSLRGVWEGIKGAFRGIGEAVEVSPYIIGLLMGLSGLSAYKLARRLDRVKEEEAVRLEEEALVKELKGRIRLRGIL